MRRQKFIFKSRFSSRLKRYLILAAVLMTLIYGGYWVIKNNLFEVKKLSINLVDINCVAEDTLKDKLPLLNQSIFFDPNSLGINGIKNEYFCIKSVDIQKHFPGQVDVKVVGRKAAVNVFAAVKIASSSASASAVFVPTPVPADSFLSDDEGVVFTKEFKNDLPKLSFIDKKFTLGQVIEKDTILPILEILQKLKDIGINIDQANIEDDTITLAHQPTLFFSTKRDVNKQVASLQLILEKAKIESKDLELVDVRFDKPIIKYAPSKKS